MAMAIEYIWRSCELEYFWEHEMGAKFQLGNGVAELKREFKRDLQHLEETGGSGELRRK